MKNILLEIKNLKVKTEGKEILKEINLKIKNGEIFALLGPNASGKSTLCQVILGNPRFKIIQGKIIFNGKDITKFSPEKRVKLGLALAWQTPPAIKGVKLGQLLEKISQNEIEIYDGKDLLNRELNVNFSGGEKKISELLQILFLKPKLAIFDEIDSGLDIKRLENVAKIIKKELVNKNTSVLLVTHSGHILNFLKPDWTLVMLDGKIICKEKKFRKVLKVVKKYGYEKCKKCKFLANRS